MAYERRREPYLASDDPSRLDLDAIHAELARSYWAEGIPREIVARALANSLCLGVYDDHDRQVAFARAVTDRATYAYIADVYVVAALRGQGLGTWLVECLLAHPDLQGLRRLALVTRDAHPLYRRFGFETLASTERHMEIARSGLYLDQKR
jgi:GNAT superfamily N-acetyltransferase